MLWQRWNRQAKLWLWVVTLIGVVAAMPLGVMRMGMEQSSKTVEYVFDYRDIVEVAELQPRPQQFLNEKLARLKEAGITTMAVYESSLRELMQAGRLTYYNEKDAALLQGKLPNERVNFTYILFRGAEEEAQIGPIVREAYDRKGVAYQEWSFGDRNGLIVEESTNAAVLKTMDFDPMTLQAIADAGFQILPRFSDRNNPYDSEKVGAQLERLKAYPVNRVLFDGDKAKGMTDQPDMQSLDDFARLLKQYDMGLATIENLKKPQAGINKLAYLTDYNVVRLYSQSPEDAVEMTPEAIADRFLLAAKDRNIRMFFLNTGNLSSPEVGTVIHTVDKLAAAMDGENGIIAQLDEAGFPAGIAQPFTVQSSAWEKPLRGIVTIAAIAFITLLVSAFVPNVAILVFALGMAGSAGLFVMNSSIMEQALALGAAISGPTLGLIWAMNRIYSRTTGERRMVGGEQWNVGGSSQETNKGAQWVFPNVSIGRRLGMALNWFVVATCITLTAVPLVFGLLDNITYSLVLEQFRGVGVLHMLPIFLVAVYVLLYEGGDSRGALHRGANILRQPVRVIWVLTAAIVGLIGYYYLSRTGNAGQVSWIELLIRNWLETTFGVRPRFKEFMLGHPPLLLGLFLAIRYRAAWALLIIGAMGQLTMVSTFTHIHTPLYISIVRTLLGLGAGIIIGGIFIAGWIVLEGAWHRWVAPKIRSISK